MIWAQVLSSSSLVRKDLRYMPNLPWVPAVSITLGAGPWLPQICHGPGGLFHLQMRKEGVITHSNLILRTQVKRRSLQARVSYKRRGPKDGLISGGIQYSITMCILELDQGGFSIPLQTGTLSLAGGWGIYFLDSFGVFACGEF